MICFVLVSTLAEAANSSAVGRCIANEGAHAVAHHPNCLALSSREPRFDEGGDCGGFFGLLS